MTATTRDSESPPNASTPLPGGPPPRPQRLGGGPARDVPPPPPPPAAPGDAEAQRACTFITAEIDRLSNVISSLLAFARPPQLAPRAVPVAALFDRALLLAADDLAESGVRVRRDAADVPAVHADPDLV